MNRFVYSFLPTNSAGKIPVLRQARVLLVDDEPQVTSALKRVLHGEPYEVVTASDAEEALGLIEKEEIDVLVTDEGLPGIQGIELLSLVRQRRPEIARIVLTGQSDLRVAKRAINEGEVHRFFTKPCNDLELVFGIRSALELAALKRESSRMLGRLRRQTGNLESIELAHPELFYVNRDSSGAVLIDPDDIPDDIDTLLDEMRNEIDRADRLFGEDS